MTMNGDQGLRAFERLVAALEPWLAQIVIVGGWAHRLYRTHPRAQALAYPPLMTLDTDIAVPPRLPVGEQNIRARLLAQGFTEQLVGGYHPPATHYHLGGEEDGGFYAEFLSPLTGSDYDRRQKRKVTTGVGGIVAQQLRYIELLLHAPWSVDFDIGERAIEIQIANPAAFLAQKVLIHAKRSREDRAKDLLYIHDTLEVFGEQLPELQRLWKELVSRQLHPRSAKAVSRASGNLFGQLTDDIRRAAEISRERALAPEAIRQLCHYGCSAVFG